MQKRFILKGEIKSRVYITIEFLEENMSIDLNVFDKDELNVEFLKQWQNGKKDLPNPKGNYNRSVEDENLLPEEIKVDSPGKVRDIEIAWANLLIQTRLLQGLEEDLNLLKEKVALLNNYSQKVFNECSNLWNSFLKLKKEYPSVSNEKLDKYKREIDILFEVLKSLRKDSQKEFNQKSIENFENLSEKLKTVERDFKENVEPKKIINKLKSIRSAFNKADMNKSHKVEIDKKINHFFSKLSDIKSKSLDKVKNKRINDLKNIISKMEKGIDWEKRQISKLKKDKERANQVFQLKLIDTKLAMSENSLKERESKLKNIIKTYNKLKKE